ncbi:hypothetical protein BDY17DRAFT_321267 [Neohortaea acidophila]|uniref:Zn(2)-C6 fungal-type domain-containing protein n=1 Tax=Neohortaea acidophila TaxID=245834 RepID=A0A6A6Q1V7_9PEZI|nr:uncharacterized protein BDY17DRAFT_321267 [Neohortaea acidophila]KAF2486478.1 hypothetical protein BDY17DRAFT_321267 [Neohortaea acidophila]
MSPSSAAEALRESFGDRKLPDISRKITACVACRKLKIKCHMTHDKPPCTRCKGRGQPCTVNKSLQTILENDATWKERIEERLNRLEGNIDGPFDVRTETVGRHTRQSNTTTASVPPVHQSNSSERAKLNLSGSLGAFPASSITDASIANNSLGVSFRPDLVSCGTISLDVAHDLFTFYKDHLDPYIHCVLDKDATLANVRARSSILTTAICTVASFCTASEDYQACYKFFKDEVSRKLFADKYQFDDARALCIGAFWLPDISSALNGLAVRIGTQLDLHRCITKMPHVKVDCYERTRLYFLIFLCDHHCSLIYGRPPMTTEFRSLKGPEAFLQSEFVSPLDLNLISQVEFWSLNRRVFDLFGSDVQSTLASQRTFELERLSDALDVWLQDSLAVLHSRRDPGLYGQRVIEFYYHSAKLYLFSHIFRGHTDDQPAAQSTKPLVNSAIQSALAILRSAVDGEKETGWLKKLPYYFGTMIAFASVCLIRTTLQGDTSDDAMVNETLRTLRNISEVLKNSSTTERSTHPLFSIGRSLEAAISERRPSEPSQIDAHEMTDFEPDLAFDFDLFASDPLNLSFPGDEDNWMFCPDQMPHMGL